MLSATMLSLTRIVALRAPLVAFRTPVIASLQRPLATSFLLRRPISTSRYLLAPVAKKAPATRATTKSKTTTARKPTVKAKAKTKAKPKAKAKAKPKAKAKAKPKAKAKAKPKKPKAPAIVPLNERPPKRPPAPYLIFANRMSPAAKTMADYVEANKSSGVTWKSMTDAEKQPYKDEYQVLRRDYVAKRDRWFKEPKNLQVLRRLNTNRVKRGKKKIHVPEGTQQKRPVTAFIRFLQELRANGQLTASDAPSNTNPAVWFAREGGTRWRALPDLEKDKYIKAYRDEAAK